MDIRKRVLRVMAVSGLLISISCHAEEKKAPIQLAILLDTSNSMDGLINQAKSRLWKIVNEFAAVKKNGKVPAMQVALYEYGNNGIPSAKGHVRLVVPLTGDLDRVSEELFSLETNGGREYCGTVIQEAADNLEWSTPADGYKAIFIAGNEPFTQGSVDYKTACRNGIKKGIIINTIHCGSYEDGANSGWKDGAETADGIYACIDKDRIDAYVEAPQDKEIESLGLSLNKTYLAYGKEGEKGKIRQEEQEKNAIGISRESFISRQVAKSSSHYINARWDIVDGVKKGSVSLESIKKEELPEEMRHMDMKEKREFIEQMAAEREEISKKIKVLNEARQKYIKEKSLHAQGGDSLDDAVVKAVRKQAADRGFHFGRQGEEK